VIFSPMAHTYAFAIGGAVVLSVSAHAGASRGCCGSTRRPSTARDTRSRTGTTTVPALAGSLYRPLFAFALRQRWLAIALALAPVAARAPARRHRTEFMPKLEEGNFWIRATLPTSVSLETSAGTSGGCAGSCSGVRTNPARSGGTRRCTPSFRSSADRTTGRIPRVLQHRDVRPLLPRANGGAA